MRVILNREKMRRNIFLCGELACKKKVGLSFMIKGFFLKDEFRRQKTYTTIEKEGFIKYDKLAIADLLEKREGESEEFFIKNNGNGEYAILNCYCSSNKLPTEKELKKAIDFLHSASYKVSVGGSVIAFYKNNDYDEIRIGEGVLTAAKKEDGVFVLISGNHRYKAMVELGYKTVPMAYVEWSELREGERQAIQHSMNSVHGEADKNILRQLLEEVKDINFREIMFVDLDDITPVDLSEVGSVIPISEHYTARLVLYSDDKKNLEELLNIPQEAQADTEILILANGKGTQDEMLDLFSKVKTKYTIKSASVAFGKILELAKKQMDIEG